MRQLLAVFLMAGVAAAMVEPAQPVRFDVLIRNGRVMDGTGNPWLRADIGITGDRIAAVGTLAAATAARTLDARDRIVAPGFIDVHSHAGEGIRNSALHQAQPLIAQGVTTFIANPTAAAPSTSRHSARRSKRRAPGPTSGS